MAMNFPASPTVGQTYSVPGGPTYTWNGTAWKVLTPGSQFQRTTFTATAGQTVFTANYTIGAVDVFQNGVKLVSGSDFTATNGTSITLTNAANVGDTIEVISYSQIAFATAAKAEDVYSVVRGMKNRIINGDMRIDQRNAGASGTGSGYTVDRWMYSGSQVSKGAWQQNAGAVTPPTGFTNYLGFTSSSAYSVLAGDYFQLLQPIEGLNCADLAFGTANAQAVTLSFWVRSSLTGTFGGAIRNGTPNRSYPFSYTIISANTWELKTVTIQGDTTGSWLTNNGIGIYVSFSLGCGSTFSSPAGSWASGNYCAPAVATSVVGTNGATFYVTGVQLESGTVTNPVFERRSYGNELMLCQRYYQWLPFYLGFTAAGTGSLLYAHVPYAVDMRAVPTIGALVADPDATQGATNNSSNTFNASYASKRAAMAMLTASTAGASAVYGYRAPATAEL